MRLSPIVWCVIALAVEETSLTLASLVGRMFALFALWWGVRMIRRTGEAESDAKERRSDWIVAHIFAGISLLFASPTFPAIFAVLTMAIMPTQFPIIPGDSISAE